jgi:hypothetical protein
MIEPEYFERKRREMGLDRVDVLQGIQVTLDAWYPGQARARQIHQGTLRIVTPSASVASQLRMRQLELLAAHALTETRVAISIQSLDH